MIEIALIISNLGLLGLLFWEKRVAAKERQDFIDAMVSRNSTELSQLKAVRAATEVATSTPVPPPPSTVEDLSDEEFDDFISGQGKTLE